MRLRREDRFECSNLSRYMQYERNFQLYGSDIHISHTAIE